MSANPDPFLDSAHVKRLTGYVRASAQLEWCKENGVQAWMSAKGEVIVPWCAIEGKRTAANDEPWVPDVTAIRGGR